jgi:hypothetical protein
MKSGLHGLTVGCGSRVQATEIEYGNSLLIG